MSPIIPRHENGFSPGSRQGGAVIGHTNGTPGRLPEAQRPRIWRLQYGPCWCHGLPGETESFDFMRTSVRDSSLGGMDLNMLILSDRVIDGARSVFLQFHDRVPSPRLVVATASCPAAAAFWEGLPVEWAPLRELLPIDVHVEECVGGNPEALLASILDYALTLRGTDRSNPSTPLRATEHAERDVVAH